MKVLQRIWPDINQHIKRTVQDSQLSWLMTCLILTGWQRELSESQTLLASRRAMIVSLFAAMKRTEIGSED